LAVLLEQSRLESLIAKAIAQAKSQGYPVLLSYAQDWHDRDGLELLAIGLDQMAASGWFFWQQAQLRLVGAGIAISAPVEGDRFVVAQKFGQDYLAKAIVGGETSLGKILPVGLAGFSFHEQMEVNRQNWGTFPQNQVYVTSWLLRQEPEQSILSLNFLVSSDSAIAEIWSQIEQQNNQLERWVGDSRSLSLTDLAKVQSSSISCTEVEGDRNWTEMVEDAKQLIEQGTLTKIVLARSVEVQSQSQIDPVVVLARLRRDYPECVTFGINLGGNTSFVGATPEFLLQFSSQNNLVKLKSDALAGSIQRGENRIKDAQFGTQLLQSKKNRQEHQIVVNSISDRLQQIGIEVEPILPPQLLQLQNVQHLRTEISAKFVAAFQFQVFQILAQLHPTAAMGGEPREKALSIMQEWEASDRGWYAAPIGWFCGDQNQESGAFVVGIRSGYIESDRARIYAGAGIVADSEQQTELAETRLKFTALLQAIAGKLIVEDQQDAP
jgi:menaquinone-specific isochorismate synthase